MRRAALFLALFCTACANDRYTPTTGDPALLRANLDTCKSAVLHQYAYDTRYQTMAAGVAGGVMGAAVIGGAAGGAIAGGAVAGVSAASERSGPMTAADINPAIERCMAEHGYVGTSEN